jgi:hypothetical protein
MATKTKEPSTALAPHDHTRYAILDPNSQAANLVGSNLAGENVSEFDLDQVKVPGGGGTIWEVPSVHGPENVEAIEGIIVHIGKRRQFWAEQDPTGDPPDCHSKDMVTGIGNPGGPCEQCKFNQFGSSKNERGKACKESRAVFLCREGDNLPIVVNIPPGSLKNLKQYLMRLPAPYFQVITRLKLSKVKNKDGIGYAEVRPELVAPLPGEVAGNVREYAISLQKTFG